ncbi:hypothetical protein YC2023_028325 [Brassica napus]
MFSFLYSTTDYLCQASCITALTVKFVGGKVGTDPLERLQGSIDTTKILNISWKRFEKLVVRLLDHENFRTKQCTNLEKKPWKVNRRSKPQRIGRWRD